jgi:hypothetical protein
MALKWGGFSAKARGCEPGDGAAEKGDDGAPPP